MVHRTKVLPGTFCRCIPLTPASPLKVRLFMDQIQLMCSELYCINQCSSTRSVIYYEKAANAGFHKSKATCNAKEAKAGFCD